MVAAHRHHRHALLGERREVRGNHVDALLDLERVDRRIADIGYVAQVEGRFAAPGRETADEPRHLAHLGRPEASPVAAEVEVEGHADERDVDALGVGHVGRAHEGRETGESRNLERVERLQSAGHP